MQHNLFLVFAITALRNAFLIAPIMVVFFQDKGLSLEKIFLLQSCFGLMLTVFEVPSGLISDLWSRKKCLFWGSVSGSLGFGIMGSANGFAVLLLAEAFLALSISLVSGVLEALVYESTPSETRNQTYPALQGRLAGVAVGSEAVAAIAGGLLAGIHLSLPFWAQTGLMALTIPLVLFLKEPDRPKLEKGKPSAIGKDMLQVFAKGERGLWVWMLFPGLAGFMTITAVWLTQPVLVKHGLEVSAFGLIWSINMMGATFGSFTSNYFLKRMESVASILSIGWMIGLAYLLLTTGGYIWSIAGLFMLSLARGIMRPFFLVKIQKHAPAALRATAVSLQSMVTRLLFSLAGPLVGMIVERDSLESAFMYMLVFFLSSMLLLGIGFVAIPFGLKRQIP